VTSEQVVLVAGPVGMMRHSFWVLRNGSPKVCHEAVGIVDCLNAFAIWRTQQHSRASSKGFNVVGHITKRAPYLSARAGLAAKPGEWRGQCSCGCLWCWT